MTTLSLDGDSNDADADYLCGQWIVTAPLAAQTISAQTIKFQMRMMEENSRGNQYPTLGIRVFAPDFSTVRGTILDVVRETTNELATSLTNRQYVETSTEVVVQDGDYLVFEVGMGGDPSPGSGGNSHDGDIRIGDSGGANLPEDNSSTDDYNPWVEFANTLDFVGSAIFTFPKVSGTVKINWNKTTRKITSIVWDVGGTGSLKILMDDDGTPVHDLDITLPDTDSQIVSGTHNLENYNDPDKGSRLRWPTDITFNIRIEP